jgi:hypothetical protein
MRKTLIALTALAGLVGVGFASTAQAATTRFTGTPLVQTVQYYGGPDYHHGWRDHEWRRHEEWRRWHRHHEWRREHELYRGW